MIESVKVRDNQTKIELKWADGSTNQLSAVNLRNNAKDAVALSARYDGKELTPREDLQITSVSLIGREAFNIQFSDGHDRAIYPFSFLKDLTEAR